MIIFSEITLTEGDYHTVFYTKHVLGGIGAEKIQNAIPYETFMGIMQNNSHNEFITVGSTASRFLKTITDNVRDILCEGYDLTIPDNLPGKCPEAHVSRYCSVAKHSHFLPKVLQLGLI